MGEAVQRKALCGVHAKSRHRNSCGQISQYFWAAGYLDRWTGEAPAAICRKVAETPEGGEIEIWGDGKQTRSFLYIEECVEGVRRLMDSNFAGPVNIGSEEMVTINQLAEMAMEIAGKPLRIRHIVVPWGCAGGIPIIV